MLGRQWSGSRWFIDQVTSEDWRFCTWIDHTSVLSVHLWSHLGCCDPAGREALGLSTHTSYETLGFTSWDIGVILWQFCGPKLEKNFWWVTYDATLKHTNNVRILLYSWTYEELEDAKPNKFLIPHKINVNIFQITLQDLFQSDCLYWWSYIQDISWYLWTLKAIVINFPGDLLKLLHSYIFGCLSPCGMKLHNERPCELVVVGREKHSEDANLTGRNAAGPQVKHLQHPDTFPTNWYHMISQ